MSKYSVDGDGTHGSNVGIGAMNHWKEPDNTKALVATLPLLLIQLHVFFPIFIVHCKLYLLHFSMVICIDLLKYYCFLHWLSYFLMDVSIQNSLNQSWSYN